MKRLNLTNLETLCWIRRLGTFAAAAERMSTTQPAVSARMKELESSIGVPLLQRNGRRMELTVQGRELVARVEPLIYQIEDVVVSLDSPAASGIVRMALGDMVSLSWAPRMVREIKRLMPRVVLEIDTEFGLSARQRLSIGKIELCIVPGPFQEHGLQSTSVGTIHLSWLLSAELAKRRGISRMTVPDVLESLPLFSLSRESITFQLMSDTLKKWHARSSDINTCSSVTMLAGAVLSGAGLALLPEIVVREQIERGELVRASRFLKDQPVEFFAAWRDAGHSEKLIRSILDIVRASSTFAPVARTDQS